MNLIAEVKRWLAKPGNTKALLAARLGYADSGTIGKWLERGSIPRHKQPEVRRVLSADSEGVQK